MASSRVQHAFAGASTTSGAILTGLSASTAGRVGLVAAVGHTAAPSEERALGESASLEYQDLRVSETSTGSQRPAAMYGPNRAPAALSTASIVYSLDPSVVGEGASAAQFDPLNVEYDSRVSPRVDSVAPGVIRAVIPGTVSLLVAGARSPSTANDTADVSVQVGGVPCEHPVLSNVESRLTRVQCTLAPTT